jgi:hypothetical protein
MSMPNVATMRASGDARLSWRMTSTWAATPMSAQNATATTHAAGAGQPCSSFSSQWRYAPAIPTAPWAKLSTPEPR